MQMRSQKRAIPNQEKWPWLVGNDPLVLTHRNRDKTAGTFQTTFSIAFSWIKMYDFRLKFHWSLFLRVKLTILQQWFRWWLGAVQATSHYLNQWWLDYRRIYASRGLNELTAEYPVTLQLISLFYGNYFIELGMKCHYLALNIIITVLPKCSLISLIMLMKVWTHTAFV